MPAHSPLADTRSNRHPVQQGGRLDRPPFAFQTEVDCLPASLVPSWHPKTDNELVRAHPDLIQRPI